MKNSLVNFRQLINLIYRC